MVDVGFIERKRQPETENSVHVYVCVRETERKTEKRWADETEEGDEGGHQESSCMVSPK
jgi:hypothetical protein